MKIFLPPNIAKILKSSNQVEKNNLNNLSTNLPKTKFNNESLTTFSNLTKKMQAYHAKVNNVIVQAEDKLFVLFAEI